MKRLFSIVLALAMVFSTFGIVVSANTGATLTVVEEEVGVGTEDSDVIYKLVFTATTADAITKTNVMFSYDNTVIQPVNKGSKKQDVSISDGATSSTPIYTYVHPDDETDYDFDKKVNWYVQDDRTLCMVASYNIDYPYEDAPNGFVFLEFYYKVIAGKTRGADTFKLEDDASEGSIVKHAMPGEAPSTLAAITIETENNKYKYGECDSTIADTATLSAFTWEGSTTGGGSQTPTKTPVDISVITIEGATNVTLPAVLNLTLGNVPSTVNAHIEYEIGGVWGTTAPTTAGTYNVKVVATVKDAEAYEITGTAPTTQVTINPEPAPEKTTPDVSSVPFDGFTEVYNGAAYEIATPDVSGIEGIKDATVTYSSGSAPVDAGTYTATLTFTVTDENLYNVPAAKTATITINKKAATFTIDNITRTYGSELPGFGGEWSGLVDDSHKSSFALRWDCDATATSNVGEYDIDATYTENSNYDLTIVPGKLTIKKADIDISGVKFKDTNERNQKTVAYGEDSTMELDGELPAGLTLVAIKYWANNDREDTWTWTTVAPKRVNTNCYDMGAFVTVDTVNYNVPTEQEGLYYMDGGEYRIPGGLIITPAAATGFETITGGTYSARLGLSLEQLTAGLPGTINATYGTGKTEAVDVVWNTETDFDIKGETYTFVGTPESKNLTFDSLAAPTVTITVTPVTVTAIEGVKAISVTEAELAAATTLTELGFPETVTVKYSAGEDEGLNATWNVTIDDLKAVELHDSLEVTLTTVLPEWATVDAAKTKLTFSVTDKTPVADVAVEIEDTVYGTALGAPTASSATVADLDFTFMYAGTTDAGQWIEKTAEAPTEAGSYKVYATIDSELYAGEGSADFVIKPKEATFTVNDDERYYGAILTDYVGSGEFDGLAYDDTDADFEIVYATTAGDVPNVGTYDITATVTNANYDVTVVPGTLTINKMPLDEIDITPVVNEENGTYTATMDVAEGQVTFEWYIGGVKVGTGATYTPDAITYSNKTITAKAVAAANGNYEGEVESLDEYTIAKYEISEGEICVGFTLDENGVFAIGETATVDYTGIKDYAKLVAAGATFEIYWKAGEAEWTIGEATYTVKEGDTGLLKVKVVATGDFAGELEGQATEIGKMPLPGEITLTVTEGVVSYTLSDDLAALAEHFDIVWYVNGDVKAVEGDTYTMTASDETVFVMAEAKGDLYSGNVASNSIGLPSDVVITPGVTKNSITVTLSASANGFDIEKYIVAIGDEAPVEVVANENGVFTHTFTELAAKTTYTITAIAVNAIGESEAEVAEITTKTAFNGGTTGGGTGSGSGSGSGSSSNNNNKTEDKTDDKTDDTTTTPADDTEVKVEVSEPEATVDAEALEGKETVSATVETTDGTKVDITADVKDSEVASLTVAADKADAEVTGKAAAGAVTEPIVITVDAKDADNNAVEVKTAVAIPAESEAYAYAVDEMGNTTRLDSEYNAETGMVEIADVADGTVVVLSTVAPAEFADVNGRWSEGEILNAADRGLVNGKLNSMFDPASSLTRSESFKLQQNIVDVLGIVLEGTLDVKVDTDASDWAYESDLWAAQAGITTGTGSLEDGTIVVSGDNNITRQDYVTAVARMLMRIIDVEFELDGKTFADAHNIAEYATNAVAYLSAIGIINGSESANGMLFNPTSNITREEAAAISNRVYAYVAGILAAK